MCPCRACTGPSGLALLHGQVLNVLHELLGGDGAGLEIGDPILWAGRQDHILTLLANEDFVRAELELLGQPYRLAAIVHEHPGSSGHGTLLGHIHKYMPSGSRGRAYYRTARTSRYSESTAVDPPVPRSCCDQCFSRSERSGFWRSSAMAANARCVGP